MAVSDTDPTAVVIVSWNVRELLRACLTSVGASTLPTHTVVVDNASADASADMVRTEFPDVTLVAAAENLGFTRGNNEGLRVLGLLGEADSRRPPQPSPVLLLNPDAELLPGALETLVAYLAEHPKVGAVGPLLLNSDGSIQSSRRRFPTLLTVLAESTPLEWHWPGNPWARRYRMADVPPDSAGPVDWVTGAAMLVRGEVLAALGGFDEGFFMYSEEVDLCRRMLSAGWQVHFVPGARVLHHEGQSSGQVAPQRHLYFQRSRVRYMRKHHGRLVGGLARWGILKEFALEAFLEWGKGLVGHKSALRKTRVAAYMALLRDGLA
jgi:GT2 family glycosyltransferase